MKQAKKPFEQIQKGTGVTTEQALSYNPVALNQVVSSHIPSGVVLPKTPDVMASGGGGGRVRAGGGGRVNALEIAQNRGPSFRDVISDPLLYASKAQEKLFDSVIDAGRSFIDTKAYTSEQKARAQKNEYIPEAKRPDAAKTIEGMVVKGADNFVTGITSTVDWLFGNALKEMGLEDNPISNFNAAMQANKEANEVYYGKNLANASKGLKTVESLGTEAVAAMPDLVLAFLTWGGSLAAEGAGALAKGGARLAGREAAAQTQNVIRRVAGEMYRNPQYWTSFSRVAGPSYEQAKADGANEWTANMYALTNGLLNAAVEVGGGIEVLPQALRKSENALLSWIKSNAEEGTEEVVQGVIERGLQNLIYGKNNPLVSKEDENAVFNPLTAAKEFGGGFVVGGLLSGGPALVNLPASIERGRQAQALREELAKAPPVQTAPRQTLKTDAGTSTDAVRIMQKLTAGEEVTPAELETAAKDRNLVRNWLQVMGEQTAEDISDADLVKALNRKAAQLQGSSEAQARSRLSEADQARYDAAKTDTARTGILAGASDENIGIAERLGQVLGRRIVFVSGASTWNGSYDSGTGVITLNANSGNPVAQIIGHELTHAIEEAGESYTKLAQLVSKRLGSDLEAYRDQIRETYLQNGQELDETGLDHEMVAKYIEENLLTNEEAISSLVQEDRTLAQRIRDLLDRILAKLGSKSAQERAFIQKARDLYAQALEAAPVTSRQQIRELNDRYRRGEISEAEYDEAFDRVYDAEDALRADVQNSFAGEIEARDVTSRRKMTAEERKNTPPDTGDENTVFADGAGRAEDFVPGDIDAETVSNGVLEVSKMEPVKEITGKEFEAGSKDLITQVSEFFEEIGGMIVNPQLGDVILNRRGAKADLAHGIGREKAAAFAAVPDVLEKGKVIDFQKNWKGRGLDTAVIAAPITIGGKPYLAGVVLRRSASENRFYLHEVLAEKNEALPFKTGTSKGTPGGNAPSVKSLLQKVYEVKRNNGIPAPPKSSTLQNSFSGPPAEGVALPQAEAKTQEERLPKKAQTYLQRARRRTMEKIAYALHIQNAESREFLKGPLTDATEEYLRSGKISEETRRKLFDAAWDEGRVILDDFYNDHKHIRDMIRTTPLNADSVKGDIADYGAFRKEHMGTLKLVSNGGSNIDTFYENDLHEMEPGLFPLSVNNTHDRLMKILEVAQSIQKVEQSLDQHYGEEADTMRMYAENDFEAYMDELSSELRQVKRYEADKAEEEKPEPITAETVTQAYRDLKEQRRTYEKAAAKNLLTEADEVAVGRILRGEDSLDGLNPRTYNVKGIRAVVEAKREYEKTARRIREYKAQQRKARRDLADTYLGTVMGWQDKKIGAAYSRETMERNIRDIVKDKAKAQEIIDAYFTPVHTHEAAATRMKNEFRERVKGLNLSRKIADGNTVSEAHAVQLLGEAMDNMRYLEQHKRVKERDGKPYEEWQRVVNALWETSPKLNRAKIEGAVEEFRKIYDELFQQMNEVRIRNGYEPINYRQGYFPHFQPGDSSGLLEQFSRALGISADVTSLPTTINGLTHQFRPGIRWFGNAQERLGFNTTYDAVEGFDKYIEGAADVINHTDDIQNLRALSDQIRYRASDKGVREQVDRIRRMDNLTEAEKNTLINETYEKGKHHLGNFVVELEEYTNLLANKRSRRDRDMEQLLGRNMYNLAKRFESRVAANMVAINPGSWLTNFIPLTQGWTTTGSRHILQGAFETLKSFKESDGMLERSSFLTNRKGSDPLVKMWEQSSKAPTKWQKVSAFGGRTGEILSSPMEYIDQFTAGTLVRARYNQNVSRGMSEDAALAEADAWAAGIMADRSKGSQPTVFSQQNPLKKVFTQFQLEVNNELSWLAKDVPDELKKKTLGGIALAIFKFLVGTYLFNDLYEALVGRRAALDPLGILNDTVGDLTGYQLPNLIDLARGVDDFKTTKKDLYDTTSDIGKEVAENLPFVGGVLGGGRVPISSALPDLDNLSKAVGKSGLSGKKRAQLIGKELGNTAAYVVLPFGGSQLKKAYQGVKAVAQGGSYSVDKDGNKLMQYPVYNDSTGAVIANGAKALLFGKSSLRGAREWVENDFDSFSKKETEAYQALAKDGVKQKDAYALLKKLHDVSGDDWKAQKSDIIRSSDVSDDQKQALYKTLLVTKDSKLDEKFTALRKTGMSWDQVMDTYDEYRKIKDGEGKANARATEFAVWVDENLTEKQADAVKEQFKIWQMMPANTDRYEGFTSAGISSKDAKKLTDDLAALVPPEGKDQTTYLQRYEAVVKSGVSAASQTEALRQLIPDTVLPKYEQTVKYNVTAEQYVKMYAATERLKQQYKKSNVNYSIAEEAISSIPGLTPKQKAVLWQIQNKSWKGSKNPYDTTVGWAVYKALNNVDADGVMLP